MIFENEILLDHLFEDMGDCKRYIAENSIDHALGLNLQEYGDVEKKLVQSPYNAVSPDMDVSFPPELDDLSRLHYMVRSRKVTTVMEFGVGKSTIVFDDALVRNDGDFRGVFEENMRRSNLFECYSVDSYEKWIEKFRSEYETRCVQFCHSPLEMGTFNDRVCTYYKQMPNVCPDFVYIDGPDQFSPVGDVNGISTRHADRLPMAADILAMEHFLLPGTLLVTDGRTANARFLKANLQRDWIYFHDVDADQHFFEMCEVPLGIYNERQIEFCLGDNYFARLKEIQSGK